MIPPHGTLARYNRCRCRLCRRAKADYERTRVRQIAYGRWHPWRGTQAARRAVTTLVASGWSPRAIAQAAGVSGDSVWRLLNNPESRVTERVAQRLCAIDPVRDWPDGMRVPADGARRRLRALAALGYSLRMIEQVAGVGVATLSQVRSGKATTVRARVWRAIHQAYETLVTPAEGARADDIRDDARRQGWPPPHAWEAFPDSWLDLPEGQLQAEIVAWVDAMSPADIAAEYWASRRGYVSPITGEAKRRYYAQRRERQKQKKNRTCGAHSDAGVAA